MIDLTKENYEAEVKQETAKPVVVDFWGPQCVPCMALKPKYHDMEHEFGDKVKFTAVDCSTNKRVAMAFRVMGLPTFLFFKNGEEVKRLSKEECTEESIRATIEELAK
ncbi:MAG TPA: thioredoxin fold domain-containing protein [Candidatus Caccocola faecipullorum]|nr:thioredoxin fold domain-containing protein [Candidatus Caccocola faecipullorum]